MASSVPANHKSSHLGSLRLRRAATVATVAGPPTIGAIIGHRSRHRWPFAPVLEHVRLEGVLPAVSDNGLRLGFVTDTHVGPTIRAADVDRAMALLFAEHPDLLLLGGDLVSESPRYIPEVVAAIAPYVAHAPLGALAVLGNHDYSNDAPRLVSHLECAGVRVLRNEAVGVGSDGADLWIAGIDDAVLGRPCLSGAFASVPAGAASIALWHEPDWATEVAPFGPFLQLSGHSHGGQLRLPLLGNVAAPEGGRRFVGGMHTTGGMRVYTSRGVGVYRPPIRFRCPPEVTVLSLT